MREPRQGLRCSFARTVAMLPCLRTADPRRGADGWMARSVSAGTVVVIRKVPTLHAAPQAVRDRPALELARTAPFAAHASAPNSRHLHDGEGFVLSPRSRWSEPASFDKLRMRTVLMTQTSS